MTEAAQAPTLKACECGCRAIIRKDCGSEHFSNLARAACSQCFASTAFYDDAGDAITAWNTRPARATAPAGHVLTEEERGRVAVVRELYEHGNMPGTELTRALLAIISRLTSTEPKP
jgi:hypothetical protein